MRKPIRLALITSVTITKLKLQYQNQESKDSIKIKSLMSIKTLKLIQIQKINTKLLMKILQN